jgi:hypothetical protein
MNVASSIAHPATQKLTFVVNAIYLTSQATPIKLSALDALTIVKSAKSLGKIQKGVV